MQYWREEQSPCGVCRGCCRLLQQEKEGNSIDIQRQQETTSPDILPLITNESQQSLDLHLSRPIKSAERQHLRECQVFRGKESNKTPELWLERKPPTFPPWSQGVLALPPTSFISLLPLQVEPPSGICERLPPNGNKRGELAHRYIVAVTRWRLQITDAGGSEGSCRHFLSRGQEIDIVTSHSNPDRRLNGKIPLSPHQHTLTQRSKRSRTCEGKGSTGSIQP